MKITFVLPGWSQTPIGGFKVVYKYANLLVQKGHDVTVVHPSNLGPRSMWLNYSANLIKKVQGLAWFTMEARVQMLVTKRIQNSSIPDADVIVATAYDTADAVYSLSPSKGKKFYFIQSYEEWAGPKETVDATWRLPMRKIVISQWLLNKAEELDVSPPVYVPNAIDTDAFRLTRKCVERYPRSVAMMWHESPVKGSNDGLHILINIKRIIEDIKVTFFSVYPRPANLPNWVNYVHRPTLDALVDIYNSHSIFLSTSYTEGWPLPPAESMSSGACLVSTANQGVLEYAVHLKNSLLSSVGDRQGLQSNLLTVLKDSNMRVRLATQGLQDIRKFNYGSSTEMLLEAFSQM